MRLQCLVFVFHGIPDLRLWLLEVRILAARLVRLLQLRFSVKKLLDQFIGLRSLYSDSRPYRLVLLTILFAQFWREFEIWVELLLQHRLFRPLLSHTDGLNSCFLDLALFRPQILCFTEIRRLERCPLIALLWRRVLFVILKFAANLFVLSVLADRLGQPRAILLVFIITDRLSRLFVRIDVRALAGIDAGCDGQVFQSLHEEVMLSRVLEKAEDHFKHLPRGVFIARLYGEELVAYSHVLLSC